MQYYWVNIFYWHCCFFYANMQATRRVITMMPGVVHILSIMLILLADSLVYKVTVSFVASTETVSSFVESHQGRKQKKNHILKFKNCTGGCSYANILFSGIDLTLFQSVGEAVRSLASSLPRKIIQILRENAWKLIYIYNYIVSSPTTDVVFYAWIVLL